MTDVPAVPEKRGPGQPTKYDPAYCEAVIEDGRIGFSLTAFAGGIGVDRSTISEWRRVHPEFDAACKSAMAVRSRFLEGGMMERDIPAPAMNARKFALVNCAPDDWRDQSTLKHVGGDPASGDQPVRVAVDVSGMSAATLAELAALRVEGE